MADKDFALISPDGDRVPARAPFHNEGKTPAGWLLALGLMLGALLVGVGIIVDVQWLWIAGIAVCAITLIASVAMRAAGLGQPPVAAARSGE